MPKPIGALPQIPALSSTPAGNPPSGSLFLYFKADGLLYQKNSSGVESKVDATGGAHSHNDLYYTEAEVNALLATAGTEIGDVKMRPGGPPTGGGTWLALDGSTFDQAVYPTLYTYLGNSNVLPDMRDRSPIGVSASKAVRTTGGSASATLVANNLPEHAHEMGHSHTINHGHTASSTSDSHTHTAGHSHTASSANELTDHTHDLSGHSHTGLTAGANADHTHGAGTLVTSDPGAHSHNLQRSTSTGSGTTAVRGNNTAAVNNNDPVGNSGAHTHTLTGSTGGQSAGHGHSFATSAPDPNVSGGRNVGHSHTITVTTTTPTTSSDAHGHTITVASLTGSSGTFTGNTATNTTTNTPVSVQDPYLAMNFYIRAL